MVLWFLLFTALNNILMSSNLDVIVCNLRSGRNQVLANTFSPARLPGKGIHVNVFNQGHFNSCIADAINENPFIYNIGRSLVIWSVLLSDGKSWRNTRAQSSLKSFQSPEWGRKSQGFGERAEKELFWRGTTMISSCRVGIKSGLKKGAHQESSPWPL